MSKIQYTKPFTFLFGYKEWGNRLLFGSLIFLIPIVGPVMIMGWCIKAMHARIRGDETLPEFDDIGDLLDVGVGPFFAQLLSILPMMIFNLAIMGGVVVAGSLITGASMRHGGEPSPVLVIAMVLVGFMIWITSFLWSVFLHAQMIRVEVTGKFGEAFKFRESFAFAKQHFKPLLVGSLVIGLIAPFVCVLGYMACIIGIYPALFIISIAASELRTQVYRRHLALGGEPIATTSFFNNEPLHLGPEV